MKEDPKVDVIMIPSGPNCKVDIARACRALEYGRGPDAPLYHVSGILRTSDGLIDTSAGSYTTYRVLRDAGVEDVEISCDFRSEDSLENYVFSLDDLGTFGLDVGVATDLAHYRRFALFNDRAKREGIVRDDFNMFNLKVDYGPLGLRDRAMLGVYSFLAYQKELIRLRGGLMQAVEKKTTTGIVQRLKKSLW